MLDGQTDAPSAKRWAIGFIAAIMQRSEAWLTRRPGDELISTLITGLMVLADRKGVLSRNLSPRERATFVNMLPLMLERVYGFWHQQGDPLVQPHSFKSLVRKFPRNAPCPCGSGKKFKRCAGLRESSLTLRAPFVGIGFRLSLRCGAHVT